MARVYWEPGLEDAGDGREWSDGCLIGLRSVLRQCSAISINIKRFREFDEFGTGHSVPP